MAIAFKKATKKKARLRMALCGPSGSGKTYTSLRVGTELAQGGKVLVLDTERGSASKYADQFDFDCFDEWDSIGGYNPERLIDAIRDASKSDYAVVIIDSLSHFWSGTGGELEMVDREAARDPRGNSFTAWKKVTPVHNKLIDTLLSTPMHVICTMRTKTEWVIEKDDRGKNVPRKIGLAPIMRDGVEFEFDVCGDMNQSNELVISKTRCSALAGQVIQRPGTDLANTLIAWLSDGSEAVTAAQSATEQINNQTASLPEPPPADNKKTKALKWFANMMPQLREATGSDAAFNRIIGLHGFETYEELVDNVSDNDVRGVCREMNTALKDAREYVTAADAKQGSAA